VFARQHGYILLTHDLDFGAILASTEGKSPSVVQLRSANLSPSSIASETLRVIVRMESELRSGALLIVQSGSTRVRLLPISSGS